MDMGKWTVWTVYRWHRRSLAFWRYSQVRGRLWGLREICKNVTASSHWCRNSNIRKQQPQQQLFLDRMRRDIITFVNDERRTVESVNIHDMCLLRCALWWITKGNPLFIVRTRKALFKIIAHHLSDSKMPENDYLPCARSASGNMMSSLIICTRVATWTY